MPTNDDVAGLSDSDLLAAKARLQELFRSNQQALRNDATNAKLLAQENDIQARLDRVSARIEFRLKQGAIV